MAFYLSAILDGYKIVNRSIKADTEREARARFRSLFRMRKVTSVMIEGCDPDEEVTHAAHD